MAAEISVVVPTYERASAVVGCLEALAAQSIGRARFEVVVCDDGSRVPVATTLAPALIALRDRLQLRIIRQQNAGPAAARNRGAAAASGRFIAFTDDDCRPERDWLARLLERLGAQPDGLLGGGLRTSAGSDRYARATQAIMDFVYAEQERRGGLRLFSTSNLALSAQTFAALGGFSSAFRRAAGEDYDLCARWYARGGKLTYVPEAVVRHEHALTLSAYWLQHFTYGRGLLRMRQRLAYRGLLVRRAATAGLPGGFYFRLIASPLRTHGLLCAALVALAQVATAAGVLSELVRPEARPPAGVEPNRTPHSI